MPMNTTRDIYMKKLAILFSVLFLFVSNSSIVLDAAVDNQTYFSFNVQGYNNSRSSGRFRDDYTNSTPWTVKVSGSTECATCQTRFWLEDYQGTNVSSTVSVGVGKRSTQRPYADASRKDNHLTAEDNDVAPSTFTVKGYWDEESPLDITN